MSRADSAVLKDDAGINRPISAQQQRSWLLYQLELGSGAHHMSPSVDIRGPLDHRNLEKAIQALCRNEEVLRLRFVFGVGELRGVISNLEFESLPLIDLTNRDLAGAREQASALAKVEAQRAFDLHSDLPFRATLYRFAADQHLLAITVPQIVCDSFSAITLINELAALYNLIVVGKDPRPPRRQYSEYVEFQQRYLGGEEFAEDLKFWKAKLELAPSALELPTDHPRPAAQRFRQAEEETNITESLLAHLRNFSEAEHSTPFLVLLTTFVCLLFRYTAAEDVVFGSEVQGSDLIGMQDAVGPFSNHLVLRADCSGDPTFREMIRRVSAVWTEAEQHQNLPFGTVVDALSVPRDLSRNPLYQVSFNAAPVPKPIPVTDSVWSPVPLPMGSKALDLSLDVILRNDYIRLRFSYSTDLFDPSTIERIARHFQTLLRSVLEQPEIAISRVRLMTPTEERQIVFESNDTTVDYPDIACVHQLVEAQVERTPSALAVTFAGQALTYSELNERANQLANYMASRGLRKGGIVAIFMDRCVEMLISVLATLKCGAGYVPLDPMYPPDRLGFMLSDAAPALILTHQATLRRLPENASTIVCVDASCEEIANESTRNPQSGATEEDLVYVIYTSGSTGKPKGVCLPHRALTNLIFWQLENSDLPEGARTSQFTSLSFDVSFQEIFSTLSSGGTLVMISESLRRDASSMLRFLREEHIARLFLPFVALQHLAEVAQHEVNLPDNLLEIVTAGEQLQCTRQLVDFFSRIPRCTLYNHYGPSESHVVTSFRLNGLPKTWPALPPIGKPISNTQIYVLDRSMNPVPIGVGGELYIGGVSLARGYLNRPGLTAQRFVPNPFFKRDLARLYKTGDVVRMMSDGNIEYLGRSDFQVKIRGFRVELGEIESTITRYPGIRQAVVTVVEERLGDKRLVAYLVSDIKDLSIRGLREFLAKSLPEYMVPNGFSIVPKLPLTPSGKVDRKSLPPFVPQRQNQLCFVAPRNELESQLVSVFEEFLKVKPVSVVDDFFDLGGHSLTAARLVSHIRMATGKQLPLAALFRASTVESLARVIEEGFEVEKGPLVMEIQHGSDESMPFFVIVPPGEESLGYAILARHMGAGQTVYKVQGHEPITDGKRPYFEQEMRDLTNQYVAAMRAVQPRGPYCLGGACDGTHIGEQIVLKLEEQGERVGLFAVFDTWVMQNSQVPWLWRLNYYKERWQQTKRLNLVERLASYKRVAKNKLEIIRGRNAPRIDWKQTYWPEDFTPRRFRAPVVLFKRRKQPFFYVNDVEMGWGTRSQGVEIHETEFDHGEILREPHVRMFGEILARRIAAVSTEAENLHTAAAMGSSPMDSSMK